MNHVTRMDDEGNWMPFVIGDDGQEREATPREIEKIRRAVFSQIAEQAAALRREDEAAATDPNWRPPKDERYQDYLLWRYGLSPGYSPTMADMEMLRREHVRKLNSHGEQAAPRTQTPDPISNAKLAELAGINAEHCSRQMKDALKKSGRAVKPGGRGHGREWSHRDLRTALPQLPRPSQLRKFLNEYGFQTGAKQTSADSAE